MTINMVESDVEAAQKVAQARGVPVAQVLRDAIRLGLPRVSERDSVFAEDAAAPALVSGRATTKRRP